jgi:succinoglycan biosynthesis protein ExoM
MDDATAIRSGAGGKSVPAEPVGTEPDGTRVSGRASGESAGSDRSTSWAVGIATYRRPAGLARAIRHVGRAARAAGLDPLLIVVDNDGADPGVAEQAARAAQEAGLRLDHSIERRPGIAAARNAIFDRADRVGIGCLAMLDDDEWPSDGWLAALARTRAATGAHVVGGPVAPVFPRDKAGLESIARFWSVQPQMLDGRPFVFCTCNFMVDLDGIRDHPRPLFDDRFGLSGGGDTVFFRSLFNAGHAMAWAADALVEEDVPQQRASVAWMRMRRYRVGNHAVNWESLDQGRLRPLAKTLALTARLAIYPLLNREPEARLAGWMFELDKIMGRWNAHRGVLHMEYVRDARGNRAA